MAGAAAGFSAGAVIGAAAGVSGGAVLAGAVTEGTSLIIDDFLAVEERCVR